MTDFSVNLVLNQSPSPPQQYSRSKDQDAAEDREEPCAGAAGVREGCAGGVLYGDDINTIFLAERRLTVVIPIRAILFGQHNCTIRVDPEIDKLRQDEVTVRRTRLLKPVASGGQV